MQKVEPKKLDCGCRPTDPWPPPAVEEAPRPCAPSGSRPTRSSHPTLRPQGTADRARGRLLDDLPAAVPGAHRGSGQEDRHRDNECFFPPYPTQASVVKDEIDELIELASLRDDPDAITALEEHRNEKSR
jgi:hypothetical protein